MTQRERSVDIPPPLMTAGPPVGPSGTLAAAQAAGQTFFDAGDDAIRRALSGDSRQFNAAMEQEGGQ